MNVASQRISADGLMECLITTFSASAINEFRNFLAKHPFVTKWSIACDFVINGQDATSDAYAFTFFPYNADFAVTKAKIVKLVPKDFKKAKDITPLLKEFFHSGDTLTICLLTPKKFNALGDIHSVRVSLDESLKTMRNWHDADNQKVVIKAFEQLRQKANANNFSAQLMSTMMIATVLAAFCGIVLAREREIEIVGWFPDRDNITTSYDRVANHMFAVNFSAFCQRYGIDERSIKTVIGLPEIDPTRPKQTWYDELVRVPDFLAGPLAGWDYEKNLVTGRQKYLEILQGAVADNPNLITLILKEADKGIGVSRLLCSKEPVHNAPPHAV